MNLKIADKNRKYKVVIVHASTEAETDFKTSLKKN